MNDAELFRAICADGPERELALVQLRELLMRGVAKSLTGRYGKPFSAEDIVQDALIKILNSLDLFQGKSQFTTWAMTIAIRLGISQLRRRYHADQSLDAFHSEETPAFELVASLSAAPAALQARQELLQILQSLIEQRLTDKQQIVMRAYLEGFSTDGMATAMNTNRNAVYKLLHDARLRLKDGLAAAGYGAEDVLSLLSGEAVT